MSKYYLNVVLLCSDKVGQTKSLETLLDSLQAAGYDVKWLEVGDIVIKRFAFWRYYDEQAKLELGIAYDKQHLSFFLSDKTQTPFALKFYVRWQSAHEKPSGGVERPWHLWEAEEGRDINIVEAYTNNTAMFTQNQWNPEKNASRLLDLVQVMYDVLQPRFAWVERCHWKGFTTPADVNHLRLPHIYWANFFSPAYVKKLGRNFLLNAPGWKKELLADGGLLYVLSPSLKGTGSKATVTAVQDYFDIPSVRRGSRKT